MATIYGFRVTGDYASANGMKLTFNNTFVTLDCGQAHINAPYVVENTASGFVVRVQNLGGAFQLGVAPDTTLRGSGSTTIAGNLVFAVKGENVSFTPHSESRSVGTFSPKDKKSTKLASSAPIPAAPASYVSPPRPSPIPAASAAAPAPIEAALANAGISTATGDARTQFRVILSANFTGTNPLDGQSVFVERKPIDQIPRALGVAVPVNANPAQAMQALLAQCHSPQGCSSAIKGLIGYYVATTKLDGSRKATLSATAATGPYYFFAIVPSSVGSLVWDVPANLAGGDNTVTFTSANAGHIQ